MSKMTAELIISLIDHVTAPSRAVNAAVDRLTAAQRRNAAEMNAARGQIMDAVAVAYTAARAIGAPVEASREFESALTDLADKGNMSAAQMDAFGTTALELAPQVNQFATEIVRASDFLVGMGLDVDKTAAAMPAIGKAATGTRASIEDLSMAAFAVIDNLKVPAEATASALDVMAYAGKEGGFELRDMAKDFPAMTASMQAFGSTGVPAVADLAAALQIVRKGAGSGAEAATNMNNILQKITAPATVRRFKEFGIDIMAELKNAQATGKSPIEMIVEQTDKALNGDLSKLGQIFEDAQVQKGMRPLIQQFDEYISLRDRALADSGGTIDNSFALQMETDREKAKAFEMQSNRLGIAIGQALAPEISKTTDLIIPMINAMTDFTRANPELVSSVAKVVAGLLGLRIATIGLKYLFLFAKGGVIDLALTFTKSAAVIIAGAGRVGAAMAGMRAAMVGATMMSAIGGGGMLTSLVAGIAALATAPIWLILAVVAGIAALGLVVHKYWEPISNFFAGVGEGIAQAAAEIGNAVGSFAEESLINVGKLFGVDPAVMQAAIDKAKTDIKAAWDGMVTFLWELPGQVGNWMGGIWEMENFSDEEEASFKDRGLRAVQMMVESAKGQMANYGGGLQLVFDLVTGNVDPLIAKLQTDPLWQATVNFWQGSIDPFIQWLWDIAHNGLKIAVDIGKSIGDAVNGITGGGTPAAPDAGSVASRIGGEFATGGFAHAGIPYLVGELGPELFVPGASGAVVTAARTARMLSDIPLGTGRFANDNAANGNSGGGPVSVTFSGDIIVQGGANASADDIADAIGRKVSAQVSGYFSDGGY